MSEENRNVFYTTPGEEEITIQCYESVFNDCIKQLGGKFTTSDLYEKYQNYKPEYSSKVFNTMTVKEVARFGTVFYFDDNIDTVDKMANQLSKFVRRYPEFMSDNPELMFYRMLAVIREFRIRHDLNNEIPVYINTLNSYKTNLVLKQVPPDDDFKSSQDEYLETDEGFLEQIINGI